MPADNSHVIVAAARRRAGGDPPTRGLRPAADGRCRRPDHLRDRRPRRGRLQVVALQPAGPEGRDRAPPGPARYRPVPPARAVPDRQRASDASLLRRLEAATARNQQLEAEDRELREALALALRERRTADLPDRSSDTPKNKSSAVIGPC
jgi:hypothetical protein